MIPSHPKVYDSIGNDYQRRRIPDERIGSMIRAALGDSKTICNVGAGTGSYEPVDLDVTAVEPSELMIAQRTTSIPVVKANAEKLPFPDDKFDAAMAILTVHHWMDPVKGLAEMQRVSRRQVIFTFLPEMIDSFWLVKDYLPEIVPFEQSRAVKIMTIAEALNTLVVEPVLIPWDCTDGFQAAYWRRPEQYLDPEVRSAISTLSQLPPATVSRAMEKLSADISSGAWHQRYSNLLDKDEMDFGYRLIVCEKND